MTDVTVQISELIQHSAWVENLARGLVRDPQAADDLVQETWLRAMKSPPRAISNARSRRAFLGIVVRNLFHQGAREHRHRRSREEGYAASETVPATSDLVAAVDSHRAVVEELLRLPDAQRDALLLRYFHDLSSAEIARRTGDSAATVRSRLKRGIAELRARLDRKAGGDAEPLLMALVLAAPPSGLTSLASSGAAPSSLTALLMPKSNVIFAVAIVFALGLAGVLALRSGETPLNLTSDQDGVAALPSSEQEAKPTLDERDKEAQRLARPDDPRSRRAERKSAAEIARSTPARTAQEMPVQGRVVDSHARPVPGASVWIGRRIAPKEEAIHALQLYGPAALEDPETPDSHSVVVTDDRGRFRFEEVDAGIYTVWAHRRDTRFGWLSPVEAPSRDPIDVVVEMIPQDRRISGVVENSRGLPYPEANVTYSAVQRGGGAMSAKVPLDDQGRFDIEVSLSAPHDIVANDPYADPARPMRAYANAVEPGTLGIVLRLGEAPILNLHVKDDAGTPIEAVRVMPMMGADGSMVSVSSYPGPHEGGLVEIPLPGQPFELALNAVGFRDLQLGPLDPATISGMLEVEMQRAPTVSGTVVFGGRPVPGARVGLYLRNSSTVEVRIDGYLTHFSAEGPSVVTGDDGRFVLYHQGGGDYRVLAKHKDFAAVDSAPLKLGRDESRSNLMLELERGGTLVVHGPEGTSEGETVALYRGIGPAQLARVNSRGFATFQNLAPGRWCARMEDSALRRMRGSVQQATRANAPDGSDLPWNCSVRAGEVQTVRL